MVDFSEIEELGLRRLRKLKREITDSKPRASGDSVVESGLAVRNALRVNQSQPEGIHRSEQRCNENLYSSKASELFNASNFTIEESSRKKHFFTLAGGIPKPHSLIPSANKLSLVKWNSVKLFSKKSTSTPTVCVLPLQPAAEQESTRTVCAMQSNTNSAAANNSSVSSKSDTRSAITAPKPLQAIEMKSVTAAEVKPPNKVTTFVEQPAKAGPSGTVKNQEKGVPSKSRSLPRVFSSFWKGRRSSEEILVPVPKEVAPGAPLIWGRPEDLVDLKSRNQPQPLTRRSLAASKYEFPIESKKPIKANEPFVGPILKDLDKGNS